MSDTLIIILAVIAVLIVGFVIFRSLSGGPADALPATPADHDDGESMADGFADATEELLGDFVGVDTHPVSPEAVSEAARLNSEEAREEAREEAAREPEFDHPAAVPDASLGKEGTGDELERIKGLGGKIAAELRARGITSYAQIAAWSDTDIAALATSMGRENLVSRAGRDRWVEQAGLLARGETAAFEEKFGKIG